MVAYSDRVVDPSTTKFPWDQHPVATERIYGNDIELLCLLMVYYLIVLFKCIFLLDSDRELSNFKAVDY